MDFFSTYLPVAVIASWASIFPNFAFLYPVEEGHYRWIVFVPAKNGEGSLNRYFGLKHDGTPIPMFLMSMSIFEKNLSLLSWMIPWILT